MKNCTPLWREAHLYVKMYKTPQVRSHFASLDPEKWHAAVARSTFVSQNVQNTTISEPFWKLRCGKMARRCGAKHICKSKCTKHRRFGAILEVSICPNGTPLWREAHLYVKMYKTPHARSHFGSFDLPKWHAAVARSTFARQNVQNTAGSEPFWKFRSAKMARRCGAFVRPNVQNTSCSEPFWQFRSAKMARRCGAKHTCTSKCTKHRRFGAILEVSICQNGTPLWRICTSKCTKHLMLGAILAVSICQNGTPLWREAHLYVKMYKTPQVRSHFGSFKKLSAK